MPVFNTAKYMRPISPVTSYYEGKAMRLANRKAELVNQAIEQDITLAPNKYDLEERRVKSTERRVKIQEDQEARFKEMYDNELSDKDRAKVNKFFDVSISAYEQAIADDFSEEDARSYSFETALDYIDQVTPGTREDALKKLQKQGFDSREFDPMKMKAFLGERPGSGDQYTLSEGQGRYGESGNLIAERSKSKGDGAIESSDSSLLMRSAHASFGGLFGANGELMPLEKGVAQNMMKVAAQAERIYIKANGQIGHQTAVEIARDMFDSSYGSNEVEIPPEIQEQINEAWLQKRGRLPTAEEMQAQYQQYLEDQ